MLCSLGVLTDYVCVLLLLFIALIKFKLMARLPPICIHGIFFFLPRYV